MVYYAEEFPSIKSIHLYNKLYIYLKGSLLYSMPSVEEVQTIVVLVLCPFNIWQISSDNRKCASLPLVYNPNSQTHTQNNEMKVCKLVIL